MQFIIEKGSFVIHERRIITFDFLVSFILFHLNIVAVFSFVLGPKRLITFLRHIPASPDYNSS
jgi:hypothetical protein